MDGQTNYDDIQETVFRVFHVLKRNTKALLFVHSLLYADVGWELCILRMADHAMM